MDFYVSYMKPIKRARIHKGACPHCNYGQGQKGQQKTGSGNTGWSEAFKTYAEAEIYMATKFGGFPDIGPCHHCEPKID